MDASVAARITAPRPNITAGRSEFVYTRPMTGLPQGDSPLLLNTSYTITADIEVPQAWGRGRERDHRTYSRSYSASFGLSPTCRKASLKA